MNHGTAIKVACMFFMSLKLLVLVEYPLKFQWKNFTVPICMIFTGNPEWKQHKPWFDEECLGFLDQRKRAKMQWVQDPCQSNVDNLNSVRREVSRHFRNKKREYLRAKIEELEANSKINNIRDLYRGINDFKKGYHPRCNIVKDEKADLIADTHSIVIRWRNYFYQLFNVYGVKDVG